MEYKFDKRKHLHTLDGKALTGVTTVLSVIAKPALIQWSANEASKYVLENSARYYNEEFTVGDSGKHFDWNEFCVVVDEAKTAHRRKKEDAGAKGTDVHEQIEVFIKSCIDTNRGFVAPGVVHENPQVQNFIDWAHNNKVVFLASEEHIYSKELWIGGICDFICEIDGEIWLGDIKTSNGIYPEHFFQVAAYQKCLEDMEFPQNIKGHIIVNVRKDGGFEEKRSISNQDNLSAFLSALNLYRIQQKLQGNII